MNKTLKTTTLLLISSLAVAHASDASLARKHARKMYLSLTGVTPSSQELDILQEKIAAKKFQEAAVDIIDQRGNIKNGGAFYSVTVKDMVTPWTNKDKTTLAPLNDMTATIIGWVRDDRQFNKILYENSVYKASGVVFKGELSYFQGGQYPSDIPNAKQICESDLTPTELGQTNKYWIIHNNPANPNDPTDKSCRVTQYPKVCPKNSKKCLDYYNSVNALYLPSLDLVVEHSLINASNGHYEAISDLGLDLSDTRILADSSQEVKLHQYPRAISGIMSTRAFGAAFVIAGTNRAPVAFAMENFLCKDMEALNDTTIPDFRNRRDVDRSPGGTSETYKNRCVGCHAGMDALSGAYAYYDYINDKLVYTPGKVVDKMNHNIVFDQGFVTQSDQWMNLWTQGQNASLGWGETTVGEGVRSLGKMLSETEAFHSCMAKQVYEKVCFRSVISQTDKARVASLTSTYKQQNFNMKKLFINASVACMED